LIVSRGSSVVVVWSRALLMPWMIWCAVCTQRRNGELYTCVMPSRASCAPAHSRSCHDGSQKKKKREGKSATNTASSPHLS
jgi:hypothetical protein